MQIVLRSHAHEMAETFVGLVWVGFVATFEGIKYRLGGSTPHLCGSLSLPVLALAPEECLRII